MAETIWVNRNDLTDMIVNEETLPVLVDGGVRLRVQSFAVTANNVTYAVAGDSFGYWNFFPAGEGYGTVPMWGHGVVEQSNHPDIKQGERVYGYLPMGTHLDVTPEQISSSGFTDAAPHRQPMSPIYNQYSRLAADPEHHADTENERMVFGPLFKTGFLIEHMFRSRSWDGAENLVMTSASSKTSLGLASCAQQSSPQIKRIGLTAPGNLNFVRSTGLYDEVVTYDALAGLAASPSVVVDFAGNSGLLKDVHAALSGHLKYSCLVGMTHVGAGGETQDMPGPEPVLFFAPDHAVAAIKENGPKAFGEAVAKSWNGFLRTITGSMNVETRKGPLSAAEAFQQILKNEASPATGIIVQP